MTKFRIGDPVRVIRRADRYFDKVGVVRDILTGTNVPFAVAGIQPHVLLRFGPDELILAEAPNSTNPEPDAVNHPPHYGGEDDPYEAIKVIEAWGLGFHLGNAVKYISRAGKKGDEFEDLKKSRWYIDRRIQLLEESQ